MAEMTAAKALGILGGSEKQPQSEQELITSIIAGMTRGEKCFLLLWDSERTQIAALIEQQAVEIAQKDRMIALSSLRLFRLSGCSRFDKHCKHGFSTHRAYENDCIACWLVWLEKEAEVQK